MDLINVNENESDISYDYKLPKKLFIGFEKGISKKDYEETRTTVFNHVKDNLTSRRNSFYRIVKIKNHHWLPDGYIYEIQEEGSQYSYVEKILETLDNEDYIVIKTKEKLVQIEKIYEGINCYYLTGDVTQDTENYNVSETDLKKIKDSQKLIPVFKENYALFVFGSILISLSVVSVFFSSVFKYGVLNSVENYESVDNLDVFPVNKVNNLDSSPNSRIRSIIYENGNWYIQKEFKDFNGKITEPKKLLFNKDSKDLLKLKEDQSKRIKENEESK